MISISHAQAKRLINAQLDERKLPDVQWTELHAHLESCAECRAYRDQRARIERRLRRGLHQHWDGVDGPLVATAPVLAQLYRERWAIRRLGRQMLGGAVGFLACVLLIVGISGFLNNSPQAVSAVVASPIPPTPLPSPTPTRVPSDYRGLIAYEYHPDADAPAPVDSSGEDAAADSSGEIYLLNTGTQPSNLTNHPANDHDPAWSPDGEWLAFLSDRTGMDEVYVIHLSGSRLTRLTGLSGVRLRGPLSWSADGQMISVIGERALGQQRQTWVYLVPLDGSDAYTLGHSAGAQRAAFSPALPMLAFSGAQAWQGGLAVYNFDPGQERFLAVDLSGGNSAVANGYANNRASVDRFDWSADGTRLLFRAQQNYYLPSSRETVTEVGLRTAAFTAKTSEFSVASQDLRLSGPDLEKYTRFSWTGIKNEYAYLDGPTPDGCQTLHFGLTAYRRVEQPQTHGFCAVGSLLRENWRVTDKSVIVTGWELGAAQQRGVYVVRFRGDTARAEWLADARGIRGPVLLRPEGERLAIDPKNAPSLAAEAADEGPEKAPELPGPETGGLLMVTPMNERTLIERVDPASGQHTLLNQSSGENACPTWSPDRSRIAFLRNNELYVMDSTGLNARRVAGEGYRIFGCPLWSADGRWLAASLYPNILIIPIDEKDSRPRYLSSRDNSDIFPLTWLPDGRLMVLQSGSEERTLSVYDPQRVNQNGPTDGTVLLTAHDWDFVSQVTLAPDGKTLAMIAARYEPDGRGTYWLVTAVLDAPAPGAAANKLTLQSIYALPEDADSFHTIGWLPDGRVGFLVDYPDGRRVKAALFAWAGPGTLPEQIVSFSDALFAADWSPDHRWLAVISETGRSVVDLSAKTPQPIWVGPETDSGLDW